MWTAPKYLEFLIDVTTLRVYTLIVNWCGPNRWDPCILRDIIDIIINLLKENCNSVDLEPSGNLDLQPGSNLDLQPDGNLYL